MSNYLLTMSIRHTAQRISIITYCPEFQIRKGKKIAGEKDMACHGF